MHPKERRYRGTTRRDFLMRTGGGAFALSSAGLLAACGNTTGTDAGGSSGGGGVVGVTAADGTVIPLARPDKPVTLPTFQDAIKDGLQAETGGTFTVFNYTDYLYGKVLHDFGDKYGVDVKYSKFNSMDEAIRKLSTGAVQVDATNITPDRLAQAVAGKLIQPINKSYIPNLAANIWPSLQSPFYDVGSLYTVPYCLYKTGIAWRSDRVTEDIPNITPTPWEIFWKSGKYKGFVGVLDDSRESITMALLRRQDLDINTEDPAKINQAVADLRELIGICNVKYNITEFQTIPEDTSYLHQAWAGDMLAGVFYYLQKPSDAKLLQFWADVKGKTPIQNDCWAVPTNSTKPVLAHLWLNWLLDKDESYSNFHDYNGYQSPQNSVTADELIAKGIVPENLRSSVMSPDDFGPTALEEMTLTSAGQKLWQDGYATATS
jgi:spermidine/putrescine transport system substrate-binding protein